MTNRLASDAIDDVLTRMEEFEATRSRANTGTGARSEGVQFEVLAGVLWDALADHLGDLGAATTIIFRSRSSFRQITMGSRKLYLPTASPVPTRARSRAGISQNRKGWFDRDFSVTRLVQAYPGEADAISRYAPTAGKYAESNYPRMYAGKKTKFDGVIVLEESGILCEKILLEYKTAKSSKGSTIDGNAHERLSFQIMQYLEVATLYPRCSFLVIANGAFARYKNKYHVNFRIQAERLAAFSWFSMEHACTVEEYRRIVLRLVVWLLDGTGH